MKRFLFTGCALSISSLFASAEPVVLLEPREPRSPVILWSTALGMAGEVTAAGDFILVGSTQSRVLSEKERPRWSTIIPPTPGADLEGSAMTCLDARTGKLRWRAAHPQVARPAGFPGFLTTSKPCVDGKRVFYLSVSWELVCADVEGFHEGRNDGPFRDEELHGEFDADILWKIDLRKDLGVKPGAAGDVGYVQSSPVVMDDLVYVVTGNSNQSSRRPRAVPAPDAPSFLAVQKDTGKVAWTSNAPGKEIIAYQGGSPAISPQPSEVIFPGGDGLLYGFDPVSGTQHWHADLNAIGGTKQLYFETQPLVADGVIVTSLRDIIEMGPQEGAPLIGIKPGATPEVLWVFGRDLGGFGWQTLCQDGVVYAVSAPNLLHAIDPRTGAERWRLKLGKITPDGMGLKLGGTAGRLFLTSSEGDFLIVRTGQDPGIIGHYEYREMFSTYARPTLSDHGLCVATSIGVLMLQWP